MVTSFLADMKIIIVFLLGFSSLHETSDLCAARSAAAALMEVMESNVQLIVQSTSPFVVRTLFVSCLELHFSISGLFPDVAKQRANFV